MCYSALVRAEFRKYQREFGAVMDLKSYVQRYWIDRDRDPYRRPRTPRAMDLDLLRDGPPELAELVRAWDEADASRLEQELFAQTRRRADAERSLQAKTTKKAQEDLRISGNKIAQIKAQLADLRRSEPLPRDSRIFPGSFVPVMVVEDGRKVVRPMRYQCRMPGWTEATERKYPGTYNARRDKLEKSWGALFGHTHGVVLATAFYEHVQRDGHDVVLEFAPQDHREMVIACLWSRTVERDGSELLSFAAITDEPPPEVAAAGHDRCIIPIRREHVDAWLQPDPRDLASLYAILDDRERPYYEHRLAA